jgi:hypothetical protein
MIRKLLTGIAALALMTGPALAQDSHYGDRVTANTLKGGAGGAGLGALIGCLVTIPIGCGPGAAVGAAWGGGGGAVIGAAATRPPRSDYRPHERDYPPPEER